MVTLPFFYIFLESFCIAHSPRPQSLLQMCTLLLTLFCAQESDDEGEDHPDHDPFGVHPEGVGHGSDSSHSMDWLHNGESICYEWFAHMLLLKSTQCAPHHSVCTITDQTSYLCVYICTADRDSMSSASEGAEVEHGESIKKYVKLNMFVSFEKPMSAELVSQRILMGKPREAL